MYPRVPIVLSTWEDERERLNDYLKNENVEIVYNSKPKCAGAGNINLQLISSKNGVKRACEIDSEYILKTRTDQRIYRDDFLEFFINILKIFPVGDNKIHNRLLGSSYSRLDLPFCINDFFMFGDSETMKKLYSIPLREDKDNDWIRSDRKNFLKYIEKTQDRELDEHKLIDRERVRTFTRDHMITEVYIIYHFLNKNLMQISLEEEDLLKKYYQALQKYFVIVDVQQIGLYWKKYFEQGKIYPQEQKKGQLDFSTWLRIYNGDY